MLDKEITKLKKIKLKQNQLFHHAMDLMVLKELTALLERLFLSVQVILTQNNKRESQQLAEPFQLANQEMPQDQIPVTKLEK